VCFLATAGGDSASYTVKFDNAFSGGHRDPSHLALFNRTVDDARRLLLAQDVIYVGGGNTVNLLAVWRAQGIDAVLSDAYGDAVRAGLPPGLAADDGVALHFVDRRLAAVVASRPERHAYRVSVAGRRLVKAPLRPIVIDAAGPRADALRPPDADGAPAALAAVP
jgi:peptidase E